MGCFSVRRMPRMKLALTLAAALSAHAFERAARADRNDLQLINLCRVSPGGGCPWVSQLGAATTVNPNLDPEATSRFRSLMSELGVVVAPRLQTPADTLGFAGFQFSAELGMTQISRDQQFWDGIQGNASNRFARPDPWLTTVGAFVRKGMWFPVPALEWGVGAINILQSGMWALQGYVKVALQEGFHDWLLPSIALRAGFSQLVGTDQVSLTVSSIDVLISKAFSVAGTARVEPFIGWNFLFIDARSGVIDGTPSCDAYVLHQAGTDIRLGASLPPTCPSAQIGTWGDLGANFTFPRQDVIKRDRFYLGVKLKLATLFAVGQIAVARAGRTVDEGAVPEGSGATHGARDGSGTQQSVSLSAGFDF
jgi:hypothetical protein